MKTILPIAAFAAAILAASTPSSARQDSFDFSDSTRLWTPGFADYDSGQEVFFELGHSWKPLPLPLDTNHRAQFLTGNNHSDDLFFFLKKRVTGLVPNGAYSIVFSVEIASKVPTSMGGIGGSPATSLHMKVGATAIEPLRDSMDPQHDWRMNIDIGHQSQPGRDMDTVGHIGIPGDDVVWTRKTNTNASHPFQVVADSEGGVWLITGLDSGFEGITEVYFTTITVDFTLQTPAQVRHAVLDREIHVLGGATSGRIRLGLPDEVAWVRILSVDARTSRILTNPAREVEIPLRSGTYVIQGRSKDRTTFRSLLTIP